MYVSLYLCAPRSLYVLVAQDGDGVGVGAHGSTHTCIIPAARRMGAIAHLAALRVSRRL
jgi:hypothetical protein